MIRNHHQAVLVIGIATLFLGSSDMLAQTPNPPSTKNISVTDTYHGVSVTEHYRWLEDPSDSEVLAWGRAQSHYARGILDNLPHVDEIRARVTEILSAETVDYLDATEAGGKYFARKRQPPKQQPFIVVLESPRDTSRERVVVDPNVIDEEGGTSIDWYEPSPNGKLLAVSLSQAGTEVGDLYFYEVASGKQVHEIVPRVNTGTAGGDIAWAPDGTGVYYTRHPREGERPTEDMNFYQQVFFHKLGTSSDDDRYEVGKDSPRIAETQLTVDLRTGRVLATIQNGDGGEFMHYVRDTDGKWTKFSEFSDRVLQAEFGPNDDLFIISRDDAPRGKILHATIDDVKERDWTENAKVVVPEGSDTIVTSFWGHSSLVPTKSRLYVTYQLGGPSVIRAFDHSGHPAGAPEQLDVANAYDMVPLRNDDLMFGMSSFLQPAAVYIFRASDETTEKTALASTSPVEFDDTEVTREFARSPDGTMVPVNIIMRKGTKRDGQNHVLAYGYGGYGINIAPNYSPIRRVLLDHGIIFAVANIRGGGEYGEQWHLEGNLTNKQNVFDDFAAVLRHLIERDYTTSERLAILGGSNGGLLMGAIVTQHPQLVEAVVSFVGIYDMLRMELEPNGQFNITEFGTVENPDHFHALHAYSPYHNIEPGTEYPAVLFLTGENDPRVDPLHSRKMTAALQAATGSEEPILLRTSADSGHGGNTALDEQIEQWVDVFAFLFDQWGIEFGGDE
jgi:prolyl oligopeptidase